MFILEQFFFNGWLLNLELFILAQRHNFISSCVEI